MEPKLHPRSCPLCDKTARRILFSLPFARVIPLNPTLIPSWFNETSIAPDHPFDFAKCDSCNFVYATESASPRLAKHYYNEAINAETSFAKTQTPAKREYFRKVLKNLLKCKHADAVSPKLLDYGAGWGDFLVQAKSAGLTNLYGLEFDDRKIAYARDNGIRLGDASWIEANKPFDMFICNQVLEHLPHPKAALKTLRGLLKLGAVGYLAVPNFDDEFLAEQIRRIKSGDSFSKNICPIEHLNYFSPASLRELVKQCGFTEIPKAAFPPTLLTIFAKPLQLACNFYRPPEALRTNLYLKAV